MPWRRGCRQVALKPPNAPLWRPRPAYMAIWSYSAPFAPEGGYWGPVPTLGRRGTSCRGHAAMNCISATSACHPPCGGHTGRASRPEPALCTYVHALLTERPSRAPVRPIVPRSPALLAGPPAMLIARLRASGNGRCATCATATRAAQVVQLRQRGQEEGQQGQGPVGPQRREPWLPLHRCVCLAVDVGRAARLRQCRRARLGAAGLACPATAEATA